MRSTIVPLWLRAQGHHKRKQYYRSLTCQQGIARKIAITGLEYGGRREPDATAIGQLIMNTWEHGSALIFGKNTRS